MYVLNPSNIEKIAKSRGLTRFELEVPSMIVLTFSNAILDELNNICNDLEEWKWKGEMFSPYAPSRKSLKGSIDNLHDIAVFLPPMGASPLVAFCEELIYFGAKFIILICASPNTHRITFNAVMHSTSSFPLYSKFPTAARSSWISFNLFCIASSMVRISFSEIIFLSYSIFIIPSPS